MNRQFPAMSGLAMVLIVLNHSITLGIGAAERAGYAVPAGVSGLVLEVLRDLGVFAVPIFLFISGCFVAYAARGNPPQLSYSFWRKSLTHILWPYLVWSIAFYVLVFLHYGERATLGGYARNLVVGYPFHFIPLLLTNYLLAPLFVRVGVRRPWVLVAIVGLFQLALIGILFRGSLGFVAPAQARSLVPPVLGRSLAEWAIYFPLGLIYGLHARQMLPVLRRIRWVLIGMSIVLFVLGFLHFRGVINFLLPKYLCPVPLVLLLPAISYSSIPLAPRLEAIGKRSYGIYLTHLLVLDIMLWAIEALVPALLQVMLLLVPMLFMAGLIISLVVMNRAARLPTRRVYRYVFG